MAKCSNCFTDNLIEIIHEGTGQKILMLPGGEVVHTCKPRIDYKWCVKCDMKVVDNGKHNHESFERKRTGLDRFSQE